MSVPTLKQSTLHGNYPCLKRNIDVPGHALSRLKTFLKKTSFVLFCLIKKRSFNLLCVLELSRLFSLFVGPIALFGKHKLSTSHAGVTPEKDSPHQICSGVKLECADFTPSTLEPLPSHLRELYSLGILVLILAWLGTKHRQVFWLPCCTLRPRNFGMRKSHSRLPRNKVKEAAGSR